MNMKLRVILILASSLLLFSGMVFTEQNSNSENGLYQIFFSPHARADAYLVDTKNGKVWTNVQYTDVQGTPTIWRCQERIDSEKEFIVWLGNQEFIKQGNFTRTPKSTVMS